MKRTIAIFALLATSCALAQGLQRPQGLLGRRLNSPLLRPPAQAPQEVYEKVPEECRASVTSAIAKKAWDAATAEVSEKFGVIVSPGKWESSWSWTNDCGKGVILFGDSFACRKFSADGRLLQTGTEDTFEEFKWRDSRRDELIAAYWNDPAIVAEAVSNSMAEVERQSRSFDARKSFPSLLSRLSSRRRGLLEERIPQKDRIQLEERIPIEEALSLAKDGKGKGFYQLAVRYALGDELPKDPKLAYQMLKKACAVNYANAILVEGLCDEYSLDGGDKYASVREAMRDYCGTADFATGRWRRDSLTNEVAVARVMGKYERAKELGVLTATNQIAALNKRLAEFKKEEAEERQKVRNAKKTEENNRRVAEEAKENNGSTPKLVENRL